jgi:hypothetical protein
MADYPRYPAGAGPAAEPEQPQAPAAVLNAVKLMYVGAAVSIISIIIGLSTSGGLKSAIRKAQPRLTPVQVNNTAATLIVATVISGLLGAGLWLWMAWANKGGRSWARLLSSVFFGISTLETIISIVRTGDLFGKIIAVAVWLVGLGAIVLLWRHESSAYYQAVSERKQPQIGGTATGG